MVTGGGRILDNKLFECLEKYADVTKVCLIDFFKSYLALRKTNRDFSSSFKEFTYSPYKGRPGENPPKKNNKNKYS